MEAVYLIALHRLRIRTIAWLCDYGKKLVDVSRFLDPFHPTVSWSNWNRKSILLSPLFQSFSQYNSKEDPRIT